MDPIADPHFVFTDDLAVFDSIDAAAEYHEFRAPITVYDSLGNAVQVTCDNVRSALPENRRDELLRNLRHHMLLFAISRPDLLNKWTVKHAPDDELIALAVRWRQKGFVSPPRIGATGTDDQFDWRAYGWGWLWGFVAMTAGTVASSAAVPAAGGRSLHELFRTGSYSWEEYSVMTPSLAAFVCGFWVAHRLARRGQKH
jgi:hypothetical protein